MDVDAKVREIIAEHALSDPSILASETELRGLGLDSLSLVEIIYDLEVAFAIDIPFDAENPEVSADFKMETVGDVARSVQDLITS